MKRNWFIIGLFGLVILTLVGAFLANASGDGISKNKVSYSGKGMVAVVRVEGVIVGGESDGGPFGSGAAGSTTLMETIRQVGEEEGVKVLLLRINSPGGGVAATQEVGDELERLKAKGIKVVTSMGDIAASGGYWLAAKSDHIVANPSTITGSIGVIMPLVNLEELYNKIGYRSVPIKSGPFKDIGSESRPMTPEEKQILQGMVDDMFGLFVDVVAQGRKMPVEKVRTLADGRIFTGRQAKDLGLVDELGNYYDAIAAAKRIGGLPEEAPVKEFGQADPFERLFGRLQSAVWNNNNSLTPGEWQVLRELLRSRVSQ